jgi:hypothetical protein
MSTINYSSFPILTGAWVANHDFALRKTTHITNMHDSDDPIHEGALFPEPL